MLKRNEFIIVLILSIIVGFLDSLTMGSNLLSKSDFVMSLINVFLLSSSYVLLTKAWIFYKQSKEELDDSELPSEIVQRIEKAESDNNVDEARSLAKEIVKSAFDKEINKRLGENYNLMKASFLVLYLNFVLAVSTSTFWMEETKYVGVFVGVLDAPYIAVSGVYLSVIGFKRKYKWTTVIGLCNIFLGVIVHFIR